MQLLQLLVEGVDQARIGNLARLAEELTECEHCAIDTTVDAIGHLGPGDAPAKSLGEDKGVTHMARGKSTELWAPLVAALNDLAEYNSSEADKKRNPERASTPPMSERARTNGRRRRSRLTRKCGSSRPTRS